MKTTQNQWVKKIIPYLLIFLFSCVGSFILFYKGLNTGDDIVYHLGNIMDEYVSLSSGHGLSPISGNLAMGLGVGNRLFYSPLPHLSIALMALLMSLFSVSILVSYKIVLFLSIFLSGILMYRFGIRLFKGRQSLALIVSALFILYPYRLFNIFCRAAISEAIAIAFIPLFFMGLYDITHFKDKVQMKAFLEVVFGGTLIYLTHNITGLYSFVFGILYLLFHIRSIIVSFRIKNYFTYALISVLLLLGLSSIAWVSQLQLLGTNLYNVSNSERMWTSLSHIQFQLDLSYNFSGFLNFVYLISFYGDILSENYLISNMLLFIVIAGFTIILDYFLRKIKVLRFYHFIISFIVLMIGNYCFLSRVECYLASIVFYLLYCYVLYIKDQPFSNQKEDIFIKNVDIYYYGLMVVLTLIMITSGIIWEHLPEIFYTIQFPWRLWGFLQFFVSVIFGYILYYFSFIRILKWVGTITAGFLLVVNEPLLEKRLYYERYHDPAYNAWIYEVDERYLDDSTALGFNREYLPSIFFTEHKSEYENSLYDEVKKMLNRDFKAQEDYSLKPVFLTGNGTIEVKSAYSPRYEMDIIVQESGIVQMPLFYYPGYEINIYHLNQKQIVESKNIDGLVSFELKQPGNYQIRIDYVGTKARQFSFCWFYLSLIGIGVWIKTNDFNKKKIVPFSSLK